MIERDVGKRQLEKCQISIRKMPREKTQIPFQHFFAKLCQGLEMNTQRKSNSGRINS